LEDNDIAPINIPYFSFKVSLSDVLINEVKKHSLTSLISSKIILHDIDIAQDIQYITTRNDVERFILDNDLVKEEDIIDDRRKVGDNCISFYNEDQSLKIKVYNKFVQMLESCEVLTVLGSRIHNIFVDPLLSLQAAMQRTSKTGVTRIEIKIYGEEIRNLLWYLDIFDEVKDNLKGYSFYRFSFEDQWKRLVDSIYVYDKQVTMVYLEEDNFFAYCHWWNKLTGKIQGGSQKNVKKEHLELLISNYSFNGKKNTQIITNILIEQYKRVENNITLIPGPKGGLYPNVKCKLSPEESGLVDYKSHQLGWVDKLTRNNLPLSKIIKIFNGDELEKITDYRISHYKAGHTTLSANSLYKVLSKGELPFRGNNSIVLEVIDEDENIIKIQCGKILEELVINEEKKFFFRAKNFIRNSNGTRDIAVENI